MLIKFRTLLILVLFLLSSCHHFSGEVVLTEKERRIFSSIHKGLKVSCEIEHAGQTDVLIYRNWKYKGFWNIKIPQNYHHLSFRGSKTGNGQSKTKPIRFWSPIRIPTCIGWRQILVRLVDWLCDGKRKETKAPFTRLRHYTFLKGQLTSFRLDSYLA